MSFALVALHYMGAAMKERPILFSAPMIRALLDGNKTQTRRIAKLNAAGRVQLGKHQWHVQDDFAYGACPYGLKGDRLWVKETHYIVGEFREVFFKATGDSNYTAQDKATGKTPLSWNGKWRPSIFMPRWASRITLEVVNVRVERLGDLTEIDAQAEGVQSVADFINLWKSINKSWDANPYVWVIEFRKAMP